MAPKRKSTSAQNLLGSKSSSSNPTPPLHVRFRDGKTQQDFLKNFQRRGVHSKCHVILSDFFDAPLLSVIRTQGWKSLCKIPLRYPIMFIQEFYSNIHSIGTSIPQFSTIFRGTRIIVTLDLISKILHVSRVLNPDYPDCQRLMTVSKNELLSHFYETPSIWGERQNIPCSGFAKGSRLLNIVMTFVLTPLSHYNSIIKHRARFLLSLLEDLSNDFPNHFITSIIDVYQDTATHDKLIFPLAITRILHHFSIPIIDSPYYIVMGAISVTFVKWSEAQLRPKRPRTKTTNPPTFLPPSLLLLRVVL
nr:hypothetical protein CFP56_28063 [Quercus suber]